MVEQFRLTVTPDGAGSAQLQAEGAKVQAARRPWDMFSQTLAGAGKVAVSLDEAGKAEKSTEELLSGQNRAAERLAEISTMSAADRAAALQADRDSIMSGESEFSDVHNKAFLAATTSTFFSAKAAATAESNMTNASTVVDSLVIPEMLPDGYDKTEAFQWISDNHDVDVATVRNMYLTKQTDYFAAQLQLQSDVEGVNEVKAAMAKNRESLGGSKFYGSKAAEWKAAIKSSEAKLKAAEVAVLKKFKAQAKERVATAIGDTSSSETSYTKPWVEVESDMKAAYGDDAVVYNNKKNEYKKSLGLAEEARGFQSENTVGEPHNKLPDSNPQLKKEWQAKVTNDATAAFTENNYSKFIGIGINEPQFAKTAGENLMSVFNNTQDIVGLSSFVNKVETISYQPNGATALRQMLGDDNYVDILATQYMAKSGFATDVSQARTMVEKSKANITTIQMDKQDMIQIDEYAREFGPQQGQAFKAVMQKLHQINPKMAHDEMKNTAAFFEQQITKVGDVRVDTSMTPIVDNVSLDPDKTMAAVFKDLEVKSGSAVTDVSMVGDVAISVNPLTGALAMTDTKVIAESINKEVLREKTQEAYAATQQKGTVIGDTSRALGTFGQVLVGQVPSAFGSFFGSAGDAVANITDRFTGYLGRQWDRDIQGMKDGINEMLPGTFESADREQRRNMMEAFDAEFDNLINNTVTKSPLDGVSRNTLSAYITEQMASTVEANKHRVEVAKKGKEALGELLDEDITIKPDTPAPISVQPTAEDRGLP